MLKLILKSNLYCILILLFFSTTNGIAKTIKDTVIENGDTIICYSWNYKNGNPDTKYCEKNGETHGISKNWYPNGQLKSIGKYNNGQLIDTFFTYFDNGKIKSITPPTGWFFSLSKKSDTLYVGYAKNNLTIGLERRYYPGHHPKRFTHYDSTGRKNGWEVFWYENGNVKDSILFRNDSTISRTSFYNNGAISIVEKNIYKSYKAISYDIKGKKTGEVKKGNGHIFVCDSLGENCKKLKFKNGKRVFK